MGFFGSFRDVVDMYNSESDENYRERGLENTQSNRGWYKCVKCGRSFREKDMDIDHILPKSLGGDNSRENLQCICKHCNRSKQDDTSDTMADLRRRKKELREQDRDDREFLKTAMKYKDKV